MVDDLLAMPVARLLELGEPIYSQNCDWPDYRSLGLRPDHVPALIQLATDLDLLNLADEKDLRGWAPVHAWRALAQFAAREAVEPLMRLFHEIEDNDWVIEEMPHVFGLIGPTAFPALVGYFCDTGYPVYPRLVAAASLVQIALAHTELRDQAVEVLSAQLLRYAQNSAGMNGVLIANLVRLDAVEKKDLIQRAFAEGKVDRFIAGDWRDIKKRLNRKK